MNRRVNTILVPVDFSENSELAISKAMELCQEGKESTIHLFHTQALRSGRFSYVISQIKKIVTQKRGSSKAKDIARQLKDLRLQIENRRNDIKVLCWLNNGNSVQDEIAKKARHLAADLIVIGKRSRRTLFPFFNTVIPGELALVTGVPVLIVKAGSLHQKIKTVVIPIYQKSPVNKLEILPILGNKSRQNIRLVIFKDDNNKDTGSRQLLLDTFRMLKSQSPNVVNYEVLEGANRAKALVKYCNKVGADVLIVYPGSETRVSNWFASHISDLMPPASKTQILAINPG
jgi:nucleotide-binding universal stress UspA family protein